MIPLPPPLATLAGLPPADLFDGLADPRHATLLSLRRRLLRFASGLSRTKDFAPAAWAGHAIGVEIGELSSATINALARVIVDYKVPAFVDSGAYGVFRRGLRALGAVKALDFPTVLARYDDILDAIADANPAEEAVPAPYIVMPDVVGDQAASFELIRAHATYARAACAFRGVSRPIIPIQRGPLPMATVYSRLTDLLGSDDFIVGVPSNAEAVTPAEFVAFLSAARPRAVHILGAFADSRVTPRLNQVLDAGLGDTIEVSSDANPLRSIIIARGQGAAGRHDALVAHLGRASRLAALADFVDECGGYAGLLQRLAASSSDQRRRDLRFIAQTTGADPHAVETAFPRPSPLLAA